MSREVRRLAVSGALLLAFVIVLTIRLDLKSLNQHVQQEMQSFTTVALVAEKSSLSFLHGIGIRLDQVSLKQQHYQVEAGHINVAIRLLPLLLGKIEINSLDIHDAIIKVRPEALQPTSAAISSLPVEQIELVRCDLRTFDNEDILNNLYLELRNIGANRETLWELKAQQQNHALSGHGRLNFYNGEISAGFGKLKLDRIPLNRVRAMAPESLFNWLDLSDGHLSGSLALDITGDQRWAIFGELRLQGDKQRPALRMRGKLEHPEADHFVWHDSFIHFNEDAVIAIDGECNGEVCETGLDAINIDLKTWAPLIPESITFHNKITGITDLNAHLQWSGKGWDSSAAFRLKDASYSHNSNQYPLPDLDIQTEELSGDAGSWRAKAIIAAPGERGDLMISSNQSRAGIKEMLIQGSQVHASLWQPLSNLLLASLDITPELEGDGTVDGTIQLRQQKNRKTLNLAFSGRDAAIAYPQLFRKPANIEAECRAEISWSDTAARPDRVALQSCSLDNSSLQTARWQQSGKKQALTINQLEIHFDQLQHHAVQLPATYARLRGAIAGSGSFQPGADNWLDQISGEWRLQNFGTDAWFGNGTVTAKHGKANFSRLLLKGLHGQAELKGAINFKTSSGDIEVLGADLDLSNYPALPEQLGALNIRGRIHHARLKMLGQAFQAIQGYYRIHQGKLNLENIHSSVAGGSLFASKLTLQPRSEGGYSINGRTRIKGIKLEKIDHLDQLLKAHCKGDLHANLELHGTLPNSEATAWRQSNGDILIYSGEWNRESKADSLTEHLGIKTPESITHAFRQLSFRFRIHENSTDISQIKLQRGDQRFSGKAEIRDHQHIQGEVTNRAADLHYSITGEWLAPVWHEKR